MTAPVLRCALCRRTGLHGFTTHPGGHTACTHRGECVRRWTTRPRTR